jgi:ribosomal protein L24
VIAVQPKTETVIIAGANIYARRQRKTQGKAGEIIKKERPLSTAKVAIINDQGKPDRIGYLIKDNQKVRIYKKTKTEIPSTK